MGKLIKSDFYKILYTKYLYICAGISVIISILTILNGYLQISGNEYSRMVSANFSSINAIMPGMSMVALFSTIAILIFVPGDFRYGTIKNVISSGANRISIYFSKMIVSITVLICYTLISFVTSFIMGSILWGVGEYTRDDWIIIIQSLSLYLIAEIAIISLYIMIAFLTRSTAITFIIVFVGPIVLGIIGTLVVLTIILNGVNVNDFSIQGVNIMNCFPGTYSQMGLRFEPLRSDDMTMGSIVSGVYILLSTLIGLVTFKLRNIK